MVTGLFSDVDVKSETYDVDANMIVGVGKSVGLYRRTCYHDVLNHIYAPTALINNDYWQNVRKSSKIILLPWCVESIILIKVLINIEYKGSQGDGRL